MSNNKPFMLDLPDLRCASCVKSIESALGESSLVDSVVVNLSEKNAIISGKISPEEAIAIIVDAGYEAVMPQESDEEEPADKGWFWKSAVPLVWGLILLSLDYVSIGLPDIGTHAGLWVWLLIALVTLGVMVWHGGHFYKQAWSAAKHRRATMDTLIAVGTAAAWLFSMAVVLFPHWLPNSQHDIYFDAAVLILGLVNLGHHLESCARSRTSEAVKKLIGLQPKTAVKVVDGVEQEVPTDSLVVGDVVRIKPGEKVPVDGEVVEGTSTVDESMLTGEPIPVSKKEGDLLSGGSINQSGSVLMKVTAVGDDTAVAHIVQAVKAAQNAKPPIARIADVISGYFVPTVIVLAIITGLVWMNLGGSSAQILLTALSVLVIACPCAVGLASPIAVMMGTGKAASYGILIRSGESLQVAPNLTAVVLDKTGTITEGQPKLTGIHLASGLDKQAVLAAAASVERHSEHPLALAVIKAAEEEGLAIEACQDFSSESGKGARGTFNGQSVIIGKAAFLEENGIGIDELKEQADNAAHQGGSPIYLGMNGCLAAVLVVSDPVKQDSKKAIERFKKAGLKVVMLTGDNEKTAAAIAKEVGITDVVANVLPAEKRSVVEGLQQEGYIVGMVGDGINDAPALTQADVGFAIGSGTDIAIASSDVTLMRSSLCSVTDTMQIAGRTLRNIKQNFAGSFVYNSIGVLVAAGVFYPWFHWLLSPWIASAAMALSSLTVVLNATRLRFIRVEGDEA